jgi:hypothetical protein
MVPLEETCAPPFKAPRVSPAIPMALQTIYRKANSSENDLAAQIAFFKRISVILGIALSERDRGLPLDEAVSLMP